MTFVLLIAAATAVLVAGELLHVRYRRLAWQRRRETFRTFASSYRDGEIHADVLAATQSYFDQITGVRDFPVRPEDSLLGVYGLAREDVQDAVAIIASTLDCPPVAVQGSRTTDGERTVQDLVHTTHRLHLAVRTPNAARTRAGSRA